MPTEHELDWALDHAPPDGGLADLRARLDAPRRLPPWWGVVPAVAVAAAVWMVWLAAPIPPEVPAGWMSDPSLVALDGGTLPGVRVVPGGDDRIALSQVEVTQEGVVMVRVASARVRTPAGAP